MEQALAMPFPERAARLKRLRKSVYSWSAARWLEAQMKELQIHQDR
jgi:trehalose-6-phosphate synthase